MKRIKVSNNVIRRMPRYLRKLDDLSAAGVERISSGELGRQMGLTPSQIRQDFSCFGEFGQQGYGYNVVALRGEIAKILGMDRNYTAVLVGTGNIGRALVENFSFEEYGCTLKAAFDINPEVVGKRFRDIQVYDFNNLSGVLTELKPDVAVLCVPKSMANSVAKEIVASGVRAIWNFTNTELQLELILKRPIGAIQFKTLLIRLNDYRFNELLISERGRTKVSVHLFLYLLFL